MSDRNLRISLLLAAVDKATRPLRGISRESSAAGQALKAARDELRKLERQQADLSSFDKLQAELVENGVRLTELRRKTAELRNQIAATDAPTQKLTRAFERARRETAGLEERQTQLGRKAHAAAVALKDAGVDTDRMGDAQGELRRRIGAANQVIDQQKRKLAELGARQKRIDAVKGSFGKGAGRAGQITAGGATAIAGGAAVLTPVALAAREAVSFEQAMADVKKVVDFKEPGGFAMISDAVLELSTRVPVAKEELAAIMAAGARAGVVEKDLLGFTETAAKMGVAFDTDAQSAGRLMAAWRNGFQMTQPQVRTLADQVNALTNRLGGTSAEVSEIVTRVGPIAGVAGAGAAEVAALATAMNAAGVGAEIAGTGVKNLMLGMAAGSAATKDQQKAFKSLSLDARAVAVAMQKDAGGAITDLLKRIQKLKPEAQAATLSELFGKESIGAIAPLLTNLDKAQAALNLVADATQYAGSMQAEYAGASGTTAMQLQLLKQRNDALQAQIGAALLPTILDLSQALGAGMNRVRGFAKAHPGLIKVLTLAAGALGAFIAVAGLIAVVVAPFALLATVAGALGIALGPLLLIIGAVVLAVGALAAAGVWLYKNWNRLPEAFGELFLTLLRFSPVGLIVRAFTAVWSYLSGLGPKFKTFGAQLLFGLVNGILGGIPRLILTVMKAGDALIRAIKDKLGIRSPSRVFAAAGDDTMEGLKVGLERSGGGPLAAVRDTAGRMRAAIAAGASAGMIAAGPAAAAPAGSAGGQGGPTPAVYNVTINAAPGADTRDLARQVEAVLRRLDRERAAAARSAFGDRGD